MNSEKYLGMHPGDLDGKAYARYWNPDMAPPPKHVRAALTQGVQAAELGLPFEEAGRLLEPGYLPLENGYTRLSSGEIFVAVLTEMPGVNGMMIDWWFGWHYMESQRYKLWHPRAHVANRAARMLGDDSSLSDREKYLENPNFVTEYIGSRKQEITITFSDAATVFDTSKFDEAGVSTVICGNIGLQQFPLKIGNLIHLVQNTGTGCEMRSRFWLGAPALSNLPRNNPLNRILASRFLSKRLASQDLGHDLLVHCAMEMNHLASFLPRLYRDYHPEAD